MSIKDTQISLRNIGEYLVKIALIAVFVFLWRVNAKQDTIVTNQKSIQKCWEKYGELSNKVSDMHHEIGMLKGRHYNE
jgi:hypothetical protein